MAKQKEVHAEHGAWRVHLHRGILQCKGVFKTGDRDDRLAHARGAASYISQHFSRQAVHTTFLSNECVVTVKGDDCKPYVEWLLSHGIPVKIESGIDASKFSGLAKNAYGAEIDPAESPPSVKRWSDEHPSRGVNRITQQRLFGPEDMLLDPEDALPPKRPRGR